MALNRCEFIGNLGADPEIRNTQGGEKVANLRIAVTERWKDRNGEKREKTEWVPVTIWGALAGIAEQYLSKGSKVYVAGKWQTRKWTDQQGNDRYSTECVLHGFDAKLEMLDSPRDAGQSRGAGSGYGAGDSPSSQTSGRPDFDDGEIPF
jgi:single-strand DNA-binding protein